MVRSPAWFTIQRIADSGLAVAGESLSGRHLKDVLDSVERYFKDDPANQGANSKIDTFFDGGEETLGRRWGKSERAQTVAKEWIARVKEMYLQGLQDADLDERFTRCLAVCGWGVDMTLRAGYHPTNVDTTHLFAPYNALTRSLGFEEPLQLTLFPIWRKKAELCRTAEIVGHILCSTYWFEGGLNTDWAGEFGHGDIGACMLLRACTCHPDNFMCNMIIH